ncbi:MAG: S-layer homology domain-containing protein [Peptococcaceae bacterium]|nr:S-layer homology domain-containing protein [Peptococcaceae bacterium]
MRKSAAVKLAACLLAASVAGAPLPSWAAGPPAPGVEKAAEKSASAQPVNPSMPLEKAIAAAREKVPVPADLDKFSSDYSEYGGKGRWMLRWYSGKPPASSMHVTVNAVTGEVENLNFYKGVQPGARYSGLPAYSREQCLEIARKEGKRLLPEKFSSTVLSSREQWHPPLLAGERDYPVVYDFYFKRTSGGIPVADQGINIGINAETGELMRFDCNWDPEAKLPSPEGRVSPGEAKKIFMEKAGLELTYFMTQREDPDSPGELRLVYRLKPPGRFVLDALTGEVADTNKIDFYLDEMGGGGGGPMYAGEAGKMQMSLTPAENRAVQETRDLIGAGRAQELAAGLVEIPRGYTAVSRNLERNYGVPGGRIWNIQFSDPDKKNHIWVGLDARTGGLISFSREAAMDPGDYYKEPEVKVSEEGARKAALDLIKKLQPARSGQVSLRESEAEMGPWIKTGSPVPRAYTFNFARMVAGVVYPENGFRVRVSSTTGEVLSYHMTWWDAEFPKTGGVIGTAAANDKYLADHPLTLEYSRGYKRWQPEKDPPAYYLIYRPSGGYGAMLDAFTGQEIDYRGKPVPKKGKQPFTDIAGHPAEEDIKLLAAEGIVTGDGGKFRPDDPATAAEVLAMLVKACGNRGPYYPAAKGEDEPWYKQVVESALAMGILDKDFTVNPEIALNRLQLARLGINAGGWGKLAGISRIFRLDAADAGSVPPDWLGYAAAAVGMDLLPLENGNFNPGGGVTRAQAASFLVKLLKR